MRTIALGNTSEQVPVIGQGTWKMGLAASIRSQEIEALRQGIEHGATLIDTAEVYSEGESERIVAEAIKDCRDDIFLVTKVWPTNGTYDGVLQAARNSLQRLQTDRIDLYLLHWPSVDVPVAETMRGMRRLVDDGLVRWIGVSNFSAELMAEAQQHLDDLPLVCNQVVYHLNNRVIENSVLPHGKNNGVTIMAYSPLGAGEFPARGTEQRALLDEIASNHGKTAFQVALNWVVAQDNVMAIPKAATPEHAVDNAQATSFTLTDDELTRLDEMFPASTGDFVVRRY